MAPNRIFDDNKKRKSALKYTLFQNAYKYRHGKPFAKIPRQNNFIRTVLAHKYPSVNIEDVMKNKLMTRNQFINVIADTQQKNVINNEPEMSDEDRIILARTKRNGDLHLLSATLSVKAQGTPQEGWNINAAKLKEKSNEELFGLKQELGRDGYPANFADYFIEPPQPSQSPPSRTRIPRRRGSGVGLKKKD